MTHKLLISRILLLAFLLFGGLLYGQEADLGEGETLFKNYCASCHNKNMKDNLTGPALGPAEANWADYPREDLYSWVRNSQALIADGHPRATELWNQWKPTVMTSFPALTDQQIENILAYINDVYTRPAVALDAGGSGGQTGQGAGIDNKLLLETSFGIHHQTSGDVFSDGSKVGSTTGFASQPAVIWRQNNPGTPGIG